MWDDELTILEFSDERRTHLSTVPQCVPSHLHGGHTGQGEAKNKDTSKLVTNNQTDSILEDEDCLYSMAAKIKPLIRQHTHMSAELKGGSIRHINIQ